MKFSGVLLLAFFLSACSMGKKGGPDNGAPVPVTDDFLHDEDKKGDVVRAFTSEEAALYFAAYNSLSASVEPDKTKRSLMLYFKTEAEKLDGIVPPATSAPVDSTPWLQQEMRNDLITIAVAIAGESMTKTQATDTYNSVRNILRSTKSSFKEKVILIDAIADASEPGNPVSITEAATLTTQIVKEMNKVNDTATREAIAAASTTTISSGSTQVSTTDYVKLVTSAPPEQQTAVTATLVAIADPNTTTEEKAAIDAAISTAVSSGTVNTTTIQNIQTQATTAATTPSGTTPTPTPVVNRAPSTPALSASSIAENSPSNSSIGTLSATDLDGDSVTFLLVEGSGSANNNKFLISGTSLILAESPNYETLSSYSVRIRASDGTLWTEQSFTISVQNINEQCSATEYYGLSINAASHGSASQINYYLEPTYPYGTTPPSPLVLSAYCNDTIWSYTPALATLVYPLQTPAGGESCPADANGLYPALNHGEEYSASYYRQAARMPADEDSPESSTVSCNNGFVTGTPSGTFYLSQIINPAKIIATVNAYNSPSGWYGASVMSMTGQSLASPQILAIPDDVAEGENTLFNSMRNPVPVLGGSLAAFATTRKSSSGSIIGEVWVTDGTVSGTDIIFSKTLNSTFTVSGKTSLAVTRGNYSTFAVYFDVNGGDCIIITTDGSQAGTFRIPNAECSGLNYYKLDTFGTNQSRVIQEIEHSIFSQVGDMILFRDATAEKPAGFYSGVTSFQVDPREEPALIQSPPLPEYTYTDPSNNYISLSGADRQIFVHQAYSLNGEILALADFTMLVQQPVVEGMPEHQVDFANNYLARISAVLNNSDYASYTVPYVQDQQNPFMLVVEQGQSCTVGGSMSCVAPAMSHQGFLKTRVKGLLRISSNGSIITPVIMSNQWGFKLPLVVPSDFTNVLNNGGCRAAQNRDSAASLTRPAGLFLFNCQFFSVEVLGTYEWTARYYGEPNPDNYNSYDHTWMINHRVHNLVVSPAGANVPAVAYFGEESSAGLRSKALVLGRQQDGIVTEDRQLYNLGTFDTDWNRLGTYVSWEQVSAPGISEIDYSNASLRFGEEALFPVSDGRLLMTNYAASSGWGEGINVSYNGTTITPDDDYILVSAFSDGEGGYYFTARSLVDKFLAHIGDSAPEQNLSYIGTYSDAVLPSSPNSSKWVVIVYAGINTPAMLEAYYEYAIELDFGNMSNGGPSSRSLFGTMQDNLNTVIPGSGGDPAVVTIINHYLDQIPNSMSEASVLTAGWRFLPFGTYTDIMDTDGGYVSPPALQGQRYYDLVNSDNFPVTVNVSKNPLMPNGTSLSSTFLNGLGLPTLTGSWAHTHGFPFAIDKTYIPPAPLAPPTWAE
jgi:hypothetical protein